MALQIRPTVLLTVWGISTQTAGEMATTLQPVLFFEEVAWRGLESELEHSELQLL